MNAMQCNTMEGEVQPNQLEIHFGITSSAPSVLPGGSPARLPLQVGKASPREGRATDFGFPSPADSRPEGADRVTLALQPRPASCGSGGCSWLLFQQIGLQIRSAEQEAWQGTPECAAEKMMSQLRRGGRRRREGGRRKEGKERGKEKRTKRRREGERKRKSGRKERKGGREGREKDRKRLTPQGTQAGIHGEAPPASFLLPHCRPPHSRDDAWESGLFHNPEAVLLSHPTEVGGGLWWGPGCPQVKSKAPLRMRGTASQRHTTSLRSLY
ncbi:hypothetical protein E2320_012752, partial [Naja naja]